MIHELSFTAAMTPLDPGSSTEAPDGQAWSEQLRRETATRGETAGRFLLPNVLFRPWAAQPAGLTQKSGPVVSPTRRSR